MLTHVGILNSTFSAFHSGNGFMLRGAGLKEWPQLTHWTNLKKRNYRIQSRSAYRQSVIVELHGSIAFSESVGCASPILVSTFNLQATILRKVPQTGNQSMASTPAFFAGCLRTSPLHSMIKTQNVKSKIVGWHKKFDLLDTKCL